MPLKTINYSSLDFVKEHNETYFELLRLARVSASINECENSDVVDRKKAVKILNQLPLFEKVHKRIIPLLNDKAHKLAVFNDLSTECQNTLTKFTQQGIVTELARKQQLTRIITTLTVHNIPLILLKGAAFAEVLYSKQAPRSSNDLDILIQKKDWDQTISVIKEVMNYTEKSQPDVFGDLYELSFVPKGKVGAALDLHMSLIHPLLFKIKEEELWQSSVEHPSFNNKLVRMLSPEHALIHQALHAYKDMDFGKYNLVDTHEIISVLKPDIKSTIMIAEEWGGSITLFVLLKNCVEIMGSDVENDLLRRIKPNPVIYNIIVKLLKSRFAQPFANKKNFGYRVNQILGQFAFTGSILRPIALQWLFIKSQLTMSKKMNE